jgi:repressor LexA
MLTLYENIKTRREALGLTKSALAELIGYDRSMITKVEQGKVDLTQSKILAFAEALKTTPSQLMGWDDEPVASNLLTLPSTKKVPLLGTIACGEPILAEENVSDYINMDNSIHADFALKCKGDSMINARIFDGDIVYIRKQSDVENGEIAAVLISNLETEATLKRVYKTDSSIRLCAANPTYADMVYEKEAMNDVTIIGKAVAFLSAVR